MDEDYLDDLDMACDAPELHQPIAVKPTTEYLLISAAPLFRLAEGAGLIGPLTRTERADKIRRYLDKKKNRSFGKVRYQCRKDLAQKRTRVQGRFVKTGELPGEVSMACMDEVGEQEEVDMGADMDM